MIYKAFIGLFFFLSAGVSFAQFGGSPEKSALRNIDKHQWRKAELRLRRSLDKDSLSPGTRYAFSLFFFRPENPAFNLDSAYHYAVTALEDYTQSAERERERLKRIPADSLRMSALRAEIDSAAFSLARQANTEAAYQEFLSHFPSAIQRDLARRLRDEVAFQSALAANTYAHFLSFLQRYPDSERAPEARRHYERLLYEAETKDRRLASYEKFLADHPETPYRHEIDRHIFEISTAAGSAESLREFTTRYPSSDYVLRARQMLFYILSHDDAPAWPDGFLNDSLQHLLAVNNTFLVPVLKNDLYGFIDENGNEVLPPRFEKIPAEYLCGHITDEVLRVDSQLIIRDGSPVFEGVVDEYNDMGIGFLKINRGGRVAVIHKGGFMVLDSLQDARMLTKGYMAVKRDNSWRLFTLTGRLLDEASWDSITAFNNVIVFGRNDKKFIAPAEGLSACANGHRLEVSDPLDEVKAWPNGLIWGRSGDFQGVLTPSLQALIGFDKHVLTSTFFGAMAALENGVVLYNWKGARSSTFEEVRIFGTRVVVRKSNAWFLFDPVAHTVMGEAYDRVQGEGPFLLGHRADTVYVHFDKDHVIPFFKPIRLSFIPGMDSSSFLEVQENARERIVFDLRGKRLFSASFDAIEYVGQGIFAVTKKSRKGLLNIAGQVLLPAEMDAIGSAKDHVLSLLKDRRFGAYSVQHKRVIKPQYDRNLLPYNKNLLTTFKNGYYGFLGWDNKPLSAFEFDEIRFWNDSVAVVRKGAYWNFYNIYSGEVIGKNLRKIIPIKNSDAENIVIVQQGNDYGVISNRRQVVIPLTFSGIINVGSSDKPLYFTEKHIKEASLFVIIYYDRHGSLLRKEIYDDTTDYDKIYCSDN